MRDGLGLTDRVERWRAGLWRAGLWWAGAWRLGVAVAAACLATGLQETAGTALAAESGAQRVLDDSASVVRVTVVPGRTVASRGEVIPVAVILDHDRRWHTQAGGADADPESVPTTVSVAADSERLLPRTDAMQWPAAERKPLRWAGPGAEVAVYSGRAIIYLPLEVRPDARSGLTDFTVTIGYQACDERVCLAPVTGQSFALQMSIRAAAADSPSAPLTHPELFADYRPVAPQLEPLARGSGRALWVHLVGAGLVVVGVALAAGAGMVAPGSVLLLRAIAGAIALLGLALWIGLTVTE